MTARICAFVLMCGLTMHARPASAAEQPSLLLANDVFCQSEADFDDFAAKGRFRPDAPTQTCRRIQTPTRVAVISGRSGRKSMVRVMTGALAYTIGWTNGSLALVR